MDTDAFSEDFFSTARPAAQDILGCIPRGAYGNVFCEQALTEEVRLSGRRTGRPVLRHRTEGSAFHVLGAESAGLSWEDGGSIEGFDRSVHLAMDRAGVRPDARSIDYPDPVEKDEPGPPQETSEALLFNTVRGLIEAAQDLIERPGRMTAALQVHASRRFIADTTGFYGVKTQRLWNLRVDAGQDGVYSIAGGTGSAIGWESGFRVEDLARELSAGVRSRRESSACPVGDVPLILGAGWGAVWLHEVIGHLLESDNEAIRRSAGLQLGGRVSLQSLTLVDDPTVADLRGSYPFDDEGSRARRTVLIRDGYLTDLLSACRSVSAPTRGSTGNGRRQDYRHPPLPRMSNLMLEPGDVSRDDLFADAGYGLHATKLGGGRLNPADGTYEIVVLEGWVVEGGRPSHPVSPFMIRGKVADALGAIRGIASDYHVEEGRGWCGKAGQMVPVSMGMPSILIDSVRVEPL